MAEKQRVLVLGATGMLGHRLANGLVESGYDVSVGVRVTPDIGSPYWRLPAFRDLTKIVTGIDAYAWKNLQETIRGHRPDVLLNCIGVIKQKSDGNASVPCIALNALLPHALEEAVASYGGRLIHFSTDCVFKGDRGQYTEEDRPDADDWYGRSKALGEVQGENSLTLRTSIIGPEVTGHRSLIDWFLMQDSTPISGYARAIYSGVTTREMAFLVHFILSRKPDLRGLYHVASEPLSKYELLTMLRDELRIAADIVPDDTVVIDRSMNGKLFEKTTGYRIPAWSEMIAGLADDLRTYWENGWLEQPAHVMRSDSIAN